MSTCISRHGEFGEHILDENYVCTRCVVLDEDAFIAQLAEVRHERDEAVAMYQQTAVNRDIIARRLDWLYGMVERIERLAAKSVTEFDTNIPAGTDRMPVIYLRSLREMARKALAGDLHRAKVAEIGERIVARDAELLGRLATDEINEDPEQVRRLRESIRQAQAGQRVSRRDAMSDDPVLPSDQHPGPAGSAAVTQ